MQCSLKCKYVAIFYNIFSYVEIEDLYNCRILSKKNCPVFEKE